MTLHTSTSWPKSLPSINFVQLTFSEIKILKAKVIAGRLKVEVRPNYDIAHLHVPTNVSTDYQFPTLYIF